MLSFYIQLSVNKVSIRLFVYHLSTFLFGMICSFSLLYDFRVKNKLLDLNTH